MMLKGQGELITRTEYLRWKYRNNDKVITQVLIAGHAFLWGSYLAKGNFLSSHLSDRLATIIERPVAVESFPWLLNHFPIVGTPYLIYWSLFLSSLANPSGQGEDFLTQMILLSIDEQISIDESKKTIYDPMHTWEDHEACWKMQYRGSLGISSNLLLRHPTISLQESPCFTSSSSVTVRFTHGSLVFSSRTSPSLPWTRWKERST